MSNPNGRHDHLDDLGINDAGEWNGDGVYPGAWLAFDPKHPEDHVAYTHGVEALAAMDFAHASGVAILEFQSHVPALFDRTPLRQRVQAWEVFLARQLDRIGDDHISDLFLDEVSARATFQRLKSALLVTLAHYRECGQRAYDFFLVVRVLPHGVDAQAYGQLRDTFVIETNAALSLVRAAATLAQLRETARVLRVAWDENPD